ncbi:hypothetical protein U1Q18_012038 [Sarracenia purpurea var. burkii]
MQTLNERKPHLPDKVTQDEFDPGATPYGKAEMTSSSLQKPEVSDFAAMMGIIYSMVKQDYIMQVLSFLLLYDLLIRKIH